MNKYLHPLYGYPLAAFDFLRSLVRSAGWLTASHTPLQDFQIPDDYFGVNVAPADNSAGDDYIVERLRELGINQVRMDFSYGSPEGPAQRLLEHLLAQGFGVALDVFPPITEAEILYEDPGAQHRWADFLADLFKRYQHRVDFFEIGNTPNRGRWSGFSSRSFLVAWSIAREQARGLNLELAGPNVSDFEPLYNANYLSMMSRMEGAPQIHTDNLFVERVVEPEAYDHRVMGRALTNRLKLNLIKKANILRQIGREAGSEQLVCTYTCWTSKRLSRRSAWPQQKQMDYLLRYLVLAASGGALRRVYWGPLICHRDGLIDDGATSYPTIDQVSFYEKIRGDTENFTVNSAFHALAYAARRLSGARGNGALHQADGLSLFRFELANKDTFVVGWCRDGMSWPLAGLIPEALLEEASFHDAAGQRVARPVAITEHPVFIEFDGVCPDPATLYASCESDIVHLSSPDWQSVEQLTEEWRGACMLRAGEQLSDLAAADCLLPEAILQLPETSVMRDVRNRLWNVSDPRGQSDQVTVKLNRAKGLKRLTYRFRPSKGRRHWNNACEMLRRGVTTPLPIAFHERPQQSGVSDSFYLCQFVPDAFSARDVYAAFRDGATQYRGLDKSSWFELLSGFVCNIHNKQIVHRDLSAGNLLLSQDDNGLVTPWAIDIGRARIWFGPGSRVRDSDRMLDLIRIAYKLNWPDRQLFIQHYEEHLGKALSPFWRIPFFYYDSKQGIKKTLKGKRSKRKKTRTQ